MPRGVRLTPEQRAEITAAIAAGQTVRQVAVDHGVSLGTASNAGVVLRQGPIIQSYRSVVVEAAQSYAARAWEALETQLRVLGDEQWIREHPSEAFGLASAVRVQAETLGRILAAVGE